MSKCFLSFIFIFIFLLGCQKESDIFKNSEFKNGDFASVAVFNGVINSEGVSLFFREGQTARNMVTIADGLSFSKYMPYHNWFPGSQSLYIENKTKNGTSTFIKTLDFQDKSIYSLFLYGEGNVETLLVKDDIIAPMDGKFKIRVAVLSPEISQSNFIYANEKVLFDNLKYKSITNFVELDYGKKYDFNFEGILKEHSLSFQPEHKKIYTMLICGKVNGKTKDDKLQVSIIKHI